MPIRGLYESLQSRMLVKPMPLSTIKGRVAIDGFSWLRRLRCFRGTEPLVGAMGGIPLTLKACMEEEFTQFSANGISPVFVFSGLDPRPEVFRYENSKANARSHAWEKYQTGTELDAVTQWFNQAAGIGADVISAAIQIINRDFPEIEVIRAPYTSLAQLAYLAEATGCVMFANDVLMFVGSTKVVLDVKWQTGIIECVESAEVQQSYGLTYEQFLDTCLLAGCEFSTTFPVVQMEPNYVTFENAVKLMKEHGNGFAVHEYFDAHPHPSLVHPRLENGKSFYFDAFKRSRVLVYNHMVLHIQPQLECKPLHPESAPNNLRLLFGSRLPPSLYYLIVTGLLAPESNTLNVLVSRKATETGPIADSIEYRALIDRLLPVHGRTLDLMFSALNPGVAELCSHSEGEGKYIVQDRWYGDSEREDDLLHKPRWKAYTAKIPLQSQSQSHTAQALPQLSMKKRSLQDLDKESEEGYSWGDPWHIVSFAQHIQQQQQQKGSVESVGEEKEGEKEKEKEIEPVETVNEFAELVMRRALSDFGYIDADAGAGVGAGALTEKGRTFWRSGRLRNNESALVLIEMMAHGVDVNQSFTCIEPTAIDRAPRPSMRVDFTVKRHGITTISTLDIPTADPPISSSVEGKGGFTMTTDQVTQAVTLVSRVTCLLQMNLSSTCVWREELDHDLAMFHSLYTAMRHTLRNHIEMTALRLFLSGELKAMSPSELKEGFSLLPLAQAETLALGIVSKAVLSIALMGTDKQKLTKIISQRYPCCLTPVEDVVKALEFFQGMARLAVVLAEEGIVPMGMKNGFVYGWHVCEYVLKSINK